MPACSFCKRNYEWPRGLSLFLNDGRTLYFCSSKCRKNMLNLKRDNRKVRWVVKDKNKTAKEEKVKKEAKSTLEKKEKANTEKKEKKEENKK